MAKKSKGSKVSKPKKKLSLKGVFGGGKKKALASAPQGAVAAPKKSKTPLGPARPSVSSPSSSGLSGGSKSKYRNLSEQYTAAGQALPSISNRSKVFEAAGLGSAGSYIGTTQQNQLLQSALERNPSLMTREKKVSPTVAAPTVLTSQPAAEAVSEMTDTFDTVEERLRQTREQYSEMESDLEDYGQQYMQTIDQIMEGSLPLNETDKAILDGIRSTYDSLISQQRVSNTAYTSGVTMAGIRAGRQRYAPEIEAGNIQLSIESGLDKIKELDNEASLKIAEARQDIYDRNYKAAKDKYDTYKDMAGEKRKMIKDLNDLAFDYRKLINAEKKAKSKLKKGLSFSDETLTFDRLQELGLPDVFEGMSEAEIAEGLRSSVPPDWFTPEFASEFYGIDSEIGKGAARKFSKTFKRDIQRHWDTFRRNPSFEDIFDSSESQDFESTESDDISYEDF